MVSKMPWGEVSTLKTKAQMCSQYIQEFQQYRKEPVGLLRAIFKDKIEDQNLWCPLLCVVTYTHSEGM